MAEHTFLAHVLGTDGHNSMGSYHLHTELNLSPDPQILSFTWEHMRSRLSEIRLTGSLHNRDYEASRDQVKANDE